MSETVRLTLYRPQLPFIPPATKSTTQPQKILLFFPFFPFFPFFCFFKVFPFFVFFVCSFLIKPEARSQKDVRCTMTVTVGGAYVRRSPSQGLTMGFGRLGLWCTCTALSPLHHEIFKRSRQASRRAGGRAVITSHLFLKRSFVNSQVTGRLRCTSCAGVLSVVCSLIELQLLLLTPLLLSSPPHTHTQ